MPVNTSQREAISLVFSTTIKCCLPWYKCVLLVSQVQAIVFCAAGSTVIVSGVDILDGTPVVDLKPYIPQYDSPSYRESSDTASRCGTSDSPAGEVGGGDSEENSLPEPSHSDDATDCDHGHLSMNNVEVVSSQPNKATNTKKNIINSPIAQDTNSPKTDFSLNQQTCPDKDRTESVDPSAVLSASWVTHAPVSQLTVLFTSRAEDQLSQFSRDRSPDSPYRLQHLSSPADARTAITSILREDPRSSYRRQRCEDSLYYFTVDTLHVTSWFFQDCVEVVRVQPLQLADKLRDKINNDG